MSNYYVHIFDDLLGQTLTSVERFGDDEIEFITAEGERWRMYHEQDCCEGVYIEDVDGDLDDLVGHPILQAEEVSCRALKDLPSEHLVWMTLTDSLKSRYKDESETWTFYKFATIKGSINIRWYGSSNGYYSESVSFYKVKK